MALGKDFFKNTFKITGSTGLAQGIGILTIPIFARLFTPDIVGQYALFTSLVGILGVFGTGRYELALMLPKDKENAFAILQGAFMIALLWSMLLYIILLIGEDSIIKIGNYKAIKDYLIFVPVAVLFTCWNRILLYWFNREKLFGYNAWIALFNSGGTKIANVGCGFVGFISTMALVFVNVFILIGEFIWRLRILITNTTLRHLSYLLIKKELIRYKKFPLIDTWNGLLDSGSLLIVPILLSFYFSDSDVGLYTQSLTLVQLPVALIASAFGQVLFQKLSEARYTGELGQIVTDTLILLFIIGILVFSIIFLLGEEIFSWFLGERWRMSGVYSELLAPWCCLKLCLSPLTFVFIVLERQGEFCIFTSIILIARVFSIIIGGTYGDIYMSILLFGISGVLLNIIGIIFIICLAKTTKENWIKSLNTFRMRLK